MKTIEVFNGKIHATKFDEINAELERELDKIGLENGFKRPPKGVKISVGQGLKMAIDDMNNRYDRAISLNKKTIRAFDSEYDCALKELIAPISEIRDQRINEAIKEYDAAIKPFVDKIEVIKNEYKIEAEETNARLERERITRIINFKKGFKESGRNLLR